MRGKITTLTYALAFALALGLNVSAQEAPASKPGQPPSKPSSEASRPAAEQSTDTQFIEQAAMANFAEIELGRLAVKKAQNADVKKFAQMMIDDHTKGLNELKSAASGASVKWPTALDDKHKQLEQRLSGLSGQEFDREYMKAMVDGHKEVEQMVAARAGSDESRTSKANDRLQTRPSSDAKASAANEKVDQWARKVLPTVRAHLKQAEQISAKVEKA